MKNIMTFYNDKTAMFDYVLVDTNVAAITNWHSVAGDIVVPGYIDEKTCVCEIRRKAFILNDETMSILIPSEISKIDPESFCIENITNGFTPTLKIQNTRRTNVKNILSCGWEIINTSWYYADLIIAKNLLFYESLDKSIRFSYRKISASEIEIIQWCSSTHQINVPSQINDSLFITSIGVASFKNVLDVQEIVVPPSIKRIKSYAFYAVNEVRRAYYSTMYIETEDYIPHKKFCKLYLPGSIDIENLSAVERGTELYNKSGNPEGVIIDLFIITLENSPTLNYFTNHGWRIARKNDNLVVLIDKSFGFPYISYDFDKLNIYYPECWN